MINLAREVLEEFAEAASLGARWLPETALSRRTLALVACRRVLAESARERLSRVFRAAQVRATQARKRNQRQALRRALAARRAT
jgi:hypothetical protein